MIYLDNAATSRPRLGLSMQVANRLNKYYGNPSTIYEVGSDANALIQIATEKIAKKIGCDADELYFTSGGTESDNWALRGILKQGDHLITTAIEHPAVLRTARHLESLGIEVTYISPDPKGFVRLRDVINAKRDNTKLVSVMMVNNETGAIQPISSIADWASANGILMHTDAVQAVGHIDVNVEELGVDLLSASAHKFGGLKGSGFLYVRKGTPIELLIYGGGQQNGMRSGTMDAVAIDAMAYALEQPINSNAIFALWQQLVEKLTSIEGVSINSPLKDCSHNIINAYVEGVDAEELVMALSEQNIFISAGSACHSGSKEPSHVLKAMGYSDEHCRQSIRISFDETLTVKDINTFIKVLGTQIKMLRGVG